MTPDALRLDAALRVEGYMSEAELRWLAGEARHRSRVVEVGSWLGRSARALADNAGGVLYCVDLWDGNLAPNVPGGGRSGDEVYAAFRENMRGANFTAARMASLDAARVLSSYRFDMIFLDADHSYEAVSADILAWKPLLAAGGLLCGHDYSAEFDGVRRAVNELLPGFRQGPGWLWYWGDDAHAGG